MKKILFLTIAITACLHNTTYAQNYEGNVDMQDNDQHYNHHKHDHLDMNRVRFGAYIAPNSSWMHPTASKSDDGNYHVQSDGSIIGYSWGLMADYFFSENYGIATGFNLNTTGGQIFANGSSNPNPNAPNDVLAAKFKYHLQFLEIPFALKLRSDEVGPSGVKIFGQVGLTLGINISRKADYDVTYNDSYGTQQTISGNNEKLTGVLATPPIDLQMNVGAGMEVPITEKMRFYTGLFFNNAFLPDATNPQNYELGYKGSFTDGNIRLNSMSLRLGLFF